MNIVAVIGKAEIALGLTLVGLGSWMLFEHLIFPNSDRHGWLVVIGDLGVLLGGLLAFAGAMLAFTTRLRWVWHIPFLVLSGVYFFGFGSDIL